MRSTVDTTHVNSGPIVKSLYEAMLDPDLFGTARGVHAALKDYRDKLGPGGVATVALIVCGVRVVPRCSKAE